MNYLDSVRALAALMVAMSHLRNFLLVDWQAVSDKSPSAAIFYWLTGFGRASVILFFVLSGYLVGGRALEAVREARFDLRFYAASRLARIYPPLILAVLVTCGLDWIGLFSCNELGYYDVPNSYRVTGVVMSVADTLTLPAGAMNLLFLQTLLVPTFGSNTPLWSLANEFWYYVLGPAVCLTLFGAGRQRLIAAGCTMLVSAGLLLLNSGVLLLFLPWAAGALAFIFARGAPRSLRVFCWVLWLLTLAAVRTAHYFAAHQAAGDFLLAASFAGALAVTGRTGSEPGSRDAASPLARMAGFSYSLYLLHVPMLFLLSAGVLQWRGTPEKMQPGLASYGTFALGMLMVLVAARGAAWLTEDRTAAFRSGLLRWFSRRSTTFSQARLQEPR